LGRASLRDGLAAAVEALSWIELEGLSEKSAVARVSKQLRVRELSSLRLGYLVTVEVLRRLNVLDRIGAEALKPRSFDELSLGVRNFLRIYTYWMKFKRATVAEAVRLLEAGRNILGWKELLPVEIAFGKIFAMNLDQMVEKAHDPEKIGLQTWHPTWFVEYCFKLLGREEATKLLQANMKPPPTYIRVNTLTTTASSLHERLMKMGVELRKVEELNDVYLVARSKKPLITLAPYREGEFYIQDKSSCLAALRANPQPGELVLDVCAAPGAKTSYLAQLMGNKGAIYSVDYSKRRMDLWKREMKRMKVKIAAPIVADAYHSLPINIEANMVLLDPPCSGTGAFWKTPSAKWRISLNSLKAMSAVQWAMMESCAQHVKVSGTLLYSTCSITTEENEILVSRFLKLHPEFRLTNLAPKIGCEGLYGLTQCERLYPHLHSCSGFFTAKFHRDF